MAKAAPEDERLPGIRGSEEEALEGGPFLGWLGSLTKEEGVVRVILGVLLFVPSVCMSDTWDKYDYSLFGAYSVVTYIDWRQTQYIAKHPETFRETNSKIGEYPSISTVNKYFLHKALIETSIAYILPDWYRKTFLVGQFVYEFSVVKHNRSIGIKFSY